ncbi:hypothetical protein NW762_013253 [Fusarium torreyae]|uniref:NACHT domain-containing protein n=1 Tax=Fusarium torreyae TaxID=1237075 RepID=A0A9W8V7K2_9HYPO|nr:hypothetical protein NW762_013253 [Fusarium torreyae]
MLTGFEALGAASAVLQVISFTGSLVPLCYSIYDGKPVQETELEEYAKRLIDTAGRVQARSQALPQEGPDEKLLVETAQKCIDAARKLKVETDYVVKLCQKGKIPKAIHAAFRSSWHRSKIERLEKTLQQCRQVMETELLFKICNKNDAIQHQQTSGFKNLETDIQTLVSRIAEGYSQIEDLVKSENHITRDLIKDESRTTQEQVNNHVTSEVQALVISTVSDKQREQLLKSLKAPEMNQRYHRIMDYADATFERIFQAYDGLASKVGNEPYDTHKSLAEVDKTWASFTSWLQSEDNRIFWVRGKPGSGKSTLMKFVIESKQTRQLLGTWNPGASIISHFFWKIGSPFQNTVQGLLCGLLYQMLSNDEDKVDQVLSHFKEVSSKDSHHDWSDRELQAVLLFILRLQTRSMCIFIDGLDEVSDRDGYLKLMKVVEELSLCNAVKLCVSSRPETQLVSRLTGAANLRLEDLTRPDMAAYVRKELSDYRENGQLSKSMDFELTRMLLGKAQGVFLWLSLAIRSVVIGIQNDDADETLIQRLSELPGELEELYTDMWTRLNGKNSVYRQTATRYFRHVIAGRPTLNATMSPGYRFYDIYGLTLAEIAIAESSTANDDPQLQAEKLNYEELKRLCAITVDDIQKRCVGLLQLTPGLEFNDIRGILQQGVSDFDYIAQEPSFIHRTAHDFLVETEAGQGILNYKNDSCLSIDTDVRIFGSITGLAATLFKEHGIRLIPGAAIAICARLAKKGYSRTSVLRMLTTLKDLCSQRLFVIPGDYDNRREVHHFISLLMNESPDLDSLIEPLLQQEGSTSAVTGVLRDVTQFWFEIGLRDAQAWCRPSYTGLSLTGLVQQSTAFGLFLLASSMIFHFHLTNKAEYSENDCIDDSESDCIMYELAKVINALAQTCPNWNERLLLKHGPILPLRLFQGSGANLDRAWVVVEINLEFLRRWLVADIPIFGVELHDLARPSTEALARIRHIGKQRYDEKSAKCWRIKNQEPFKDLIDVAFRPARFQEKDLDHFIEIADLPGNAETVTLEDENTALVRSGFFETDIQRIFPPS